MKCASRLPAQSRSVFASAKAGHGFTLIELSIVLVIIGLIIGGVLVGKEMIAAARVRAQITQLEQYNTAVNTFQAKYNCLPGDCANATNFFTNVNNGNGNGFIDANPPGNLPTDEMMNCFPELSQAGLISGNFSNVASVRAVPDNLPADKIGRGSIGCWAGDSGGGTWLLGLPSSFDLTQGGGWWTPLFADPLTPLEALQIDSKIDDGKPGTGSVQGWDWVWANGTDDCLSDLNYNGDTDYTHDPAKQNGTNCGLSVTWGGVSPPFGG